MNTKKGFASLVLVILVVVIAAGLGYFAFKNSKTQTPAPAQNQNQQPVVSTTTPTTNETSDWQTYRNEKYGFEFKYPADWKYQPTDLNILKNRGAIDIYGMPPSEVLYAGDFGGRLQLYASNFVNCKDEETWLYKGIRQDNRAISSRKNITVDGILSPTVSYYQCGSSSAPSCWASITVCITNNPSVTMILDGKEESGKPNTETVSLLNEIISTFKFTK